MSGRLAAFGLWLAAAGIAAAVLFVPVAWAATDMPASRALQNLGPVSAFVVPGQTMVLREPVDTVALPVRVGGPFGSIAPLRLVARANHADTTVLGSSEGAARARPERYDVVLFRFDRALKPDEAAYLELQVPPQTEWPILVASTTADSQRSDGRLYLRGEPAFADLDLAYQLLRHESLAFRLPLLWRQHREALVVSIATLAAVAALILGLVCAADRRASWRTRLAVSAAAFSGSLGVVYAFIFV